MKIYKIASAVSRAAVPPQIVVIRSLEAFATYAKSIWNLSPFFLP